MPEYLGFLQKMGMRPELKVQTPGGEILIAEGFEPLPTQEYPKPHYKVAWAVLRSKFDLGRILYFDADHNAEYDAGSRKKTRIKAAITDATGFIQENMRAGRYV